MATWKETCLSTPPQLYPVCDPSSPTASYELINLLSSDTEAETPNALYRSLVEFAKRCAITWHEAQAVETLRSRIEEEAQEVLPGCRAALFGSKATGLSLPTSDVDIVILGTSYDIFAPRQSFTSGQRQEIMSLLSTLRRQLTSWTKMGGGKLIRATVPILRLEMPSDGMLFHVDISIGVRNAIDAVCMIRSYLTANPVILPLFVVLKALLKERALNEVYRGGMSSYVLFTTVVAHLMMENVFRPPEEQHLKEEGFTMENQSAFLMKLLSKIDLPLDTLLKKFLTRFGNWDERFAVSLQGQGKIPVYELESVIEGRVMQVEDPQAAGMDASKGSFAMAHVLEIFRKTNEKLESCLASPKTSSSLTMKESFPILNHIMDCQAFLKRPEMMQRKKRSRDRSNHKGIRKKRRTRSKQTGTSSNGRIDSHT